MALEAYRRKRRFDRTPEPRGRARRRSGRRLSYFIQRHAARRLHYDFRLELDGALKSWAVPKGPSLDPRDKRLAVHVEDHPLEYGPFEGDIPRGQYGAGHVDLWDRGEWVPDGDAREMYRKGRLKFRLRGKRLSGAWDLVRMGGSAGEDGKNWLLIKVDDEAARRGGAAPEPAPPAPVAPAARDLVELATLAEETPAGPEWVHEIKFDGYRIVARVAGGRAVLLSRRGNDWTGNFPAVAAALERLSPREAVLDGEVVVLDDQGRSDFQALQNALSARDEARLVYYAFDLLELDGRDLRGRPLRERKEELAALLARGGRKAGRAFRDRVRLAEHVEGQGRALYARACQLGLEGVVSKRAGAPYRAGRAGDWVKVKCLLAQEFVVAGFTDPGGARPGFGALLLGAREGGTFRYVGRVGTGFTDRSLKRLDALLRGLETDRCPFPSVPADARRGVHWVEPRLVAETAFRGWTSDGILRQASFKGLREDKAAAEVVVETPVRAPAGPARVGGVRISHPDRVLFPDIGITKKDLAAYYEAASGRLLARAAGRPLALLRCPSGPGKDCFFQKRAGDSFPSSVRAGTYREKGETKELLYVEDAEGLLALAQAGVIELHLWGAPVRDLERPDELVFDLDPAPETPWSEVLAAAREVRARLRDAGLVPLLKTTGGKGLHVVAPLKPGHGWDEHKAWARALAERMAGEEPRRWTTKLSKDARAGRLFVDYLRNGRGATAVAPYSARARAGAPVATPLAWEELRPSLRPERFNVRTLARRLSAADPWSGYERARRALPRS